MSGVSIVFPAFSNVLKARGEKDLWLERRDGRSLSSSQRRSNPFLLASFVVVHVRLASRGLGNSRSRRVRVAKGEDVGEETRRTERRKRDETEKSPSFAASTDVSRRFSAKFPQRDITESFVSCTYSAMLDREFRGNLPLNFRYKTWVFQRARTSSFLSGQTIRLTLFYFFVGMFHVIKRDTEKECAITCEIKDNGECICIIATKT